MNSKEILRAIDGFQSGMYSELEFFNLLAIRTHIDAVRDTYDVPPKSTKKDFCDGLMTMTHRVTPCALEKTLLNQVLLKP